MKLALGVIAALSLLSISSCLWSEEWFPAHVVAVTLPESTVGGSSMPVTVYTSRSDCTAGTRAGPFVAVNDSTFELRIETSAGTPGVGCPGGILAGTFQMSGTPSHRFHVRIVGADTIDAVVQGHGEPSPASRVEEIFRLREEHLHFPPNSLSILLFSCKAESSDNVWCDDTLATMDVDTTGIATYEGACTLDGVPYRAEIRYRPTARMTSTLLDLTGKFHCGEPWQTIVRGFE